MKVTFVWPAELEIDEAIRFYEIQQEGLGRRFYGELRSAIARILEFPSAWTRVGPNSRRCLLKRFPYAILFAVRKDEVLILAVAHQHRDPTHYAHRLI